jgi:phosphoribosyl 1,2-cyclic phosphodiesterase
MNVEIFASGSSGNFYAVSDGETRLLLECGVGIQRIKESLNFRLSEVAGCLVSHAHGDHAKSAAALIKAGIDIYASAATFELLNLTGWRCKAIRGVDARYPVVNIGTFSVLAFDAVHDCEGTLGFLIGSAVTSDKLVYLTDSMYCPHIFTGITHWLIECNYSTQDVTRWADYNRVVKTHMSLETVLRLLKANDLSGVKQIYLLHMSDDNSDEARFKTEVQKATGAEVYVA